MTTVVEGRELRLDPKHVADIMSAEPTIGRRPNIFNFGPGGLAMTFGRHAKKTTSIIVTVAEWNGDPWLHASIAHPDRLPTYRELSALHRAVFGDGHAYQVFVGGTKHNIHENALHLWGRADGTNALPDFGAFGSI